MKGTTPRARLLEFIKAHIARTGQSPTIREMSKGAGISSTSVIDYHLRALESIGLIEREPNTIRGVRVIALANAQDALIGEANDQDGRKAMAHKNALGGRAKHSISDLRSHSYGRPHASGCMLCGTGEQGSHGVPLELDHFYPLARGGVDANYNWILLCQDCNRKKSDREPVSFVLDNYGVRELKAIIAFLLTEEASNDQ